MSGSKPLLSICALGYEHAAFIKDCIARLWEDPWQDKEIIAMDDGSGDGSLEILRTMAKESPCKFTVIEQEHTGKVGANFNKLCKAASGDFVLFTSLDDMQISGAITARMERLLADPNCVFATHTRHIQMLGEECKPGTMPMEELVGIEGNGKELAERALEMERTKLHSFFIQGAIFRKSIVDMVRGFNENMIADDIVLRTKVYLHMLRHPELNYALINEPGFIYRRHPRSTSLNAKRQMLLVYQYYEKFWKGYPYPNLFKWQLMICFDVLSYADIMDLLYTAPGMTSLFKDEDVRDGLKTSAVKEFIKEKGSAKQEAENIAISQ